jgi:spore germination protein KC
LLNESVKKHDFVTTFPDPFKKKYRITTRLIKSEKNDTKMVLNNGEPTIHVKIPIKIEVLTDHSMVNYAKNKEKRDLLKAYLNKRINKKLDKLITKTQKEFKGEPFSWSLIARRNFLTNPAYEKFDWMKTYPEMNIEVSLDIKFGEFGRQAELPQLKKVRD